MGRGPSRLTPEPPSDPERQMERVAPETAPGGQAQQRKLVIVADFGNERNKLRMETRITLFTFPGCAKERDLILPTNPTNPTQRLTAGFAVTPHPKRPSVLVIGGQYCNNIVTEFSPHVWEISLEGGTFGKPSYRRLANIPVAMDILAACVHDHEQGPHLYLLGNSEQLWRMGLHSRKWERVASPTYILGRRVQAMISAKDKLFIIAKTFCLVYREDSTTQGGYCGQWTLLSERYPNGAHATLNDAVVTFAFDTQIIFTLDDDDGRLVGLHKPGKGYFGKTTQMFSIGKKLYFTGIPVCEEQVTLTVLDLDKQQPIVAGYLEGVPERHKAFIC